MRVSISRSLEPVSMLDCIAKVADRVKVGHRVPLRYRNYLGLLGRVQYNHKGP